MSDHKKNPAGHAANLSLPDARQGTPVPVSGTGLRRRELLLATLALGWGETSAWGKQSPLLIARYQKTAEPMAGKGYVAMSLTRTGYVRYMRSIVLKLRAGDAASPGTEAAKLEIEGRNFLVAPPALSESKRMEFVTSEFPWGEMRALEVPAGTYVLNDQRTYGASGDGGLAIDIRVAAGELAYVGNLNAHFLFGDVYKLTLADQGKRDLQLLFSTRPELRELPTRTRLNGKEV